MESHVLRSCFNLSHLNLVCVIFVPLLKLFNTSMFYIGTMTSRYVKAKIRKFEKRFNELKKVTKECLKKRNVSVKRIVDLLTVMPADDIEEHKQFLGENLSDLYDSSDVSELFGKLDLLHWDYLSYQLLEYLIKEFGLEVERDMEAYKLDLQKFRQKTPLALFCQSQKRRRRKPSEEFQEMVAEFDWPHEVTLEVVEQFRQEYTYHYNLRECAMMLAEIHPGSFVVTWFVPESIVNKLSNNMPKSILNKYSVDNLRIAGVSVFPSPKVNGGVYRSNNMHFLYVMSHEACLICVCSWTCLMLLSI